jgi:S-formylglutathione hydrolase FrmB
VVAARVSWHELEVESVALAGNPLGDPSTRPLFVWTPPAYGGDPDRRFPSIYVLQGLTGQVRAWFNVAPFSKGFPELLEKAGVEAIVVLLDAFTALGGSQFIDSPAIGRYGTYFCEEVVPFVDERFRTLPEPRHRGVQGKSSGGYGAMVWGMLRPDLFGAFATHAGDALFEVSLASDFAKAAQALRNRYDGSYESFWSDFRSGRPVLSDRDDAVLLAVYAAAAAYSPRDDGSVELPFRLDTGALVPEVWERWLAWDPVHLAATHGEALRAARGIWIDAGRNDEYFLDLGAVAFRDAVLASGVDEANVRFELFEGTHRNVGWRYPLSLAFLAERLAV